QPVTSTPYALRTISAALADNATNATQLGGVTANQYVQTSDSRLSGPRPPTIGSSNYIQNTTSAQAGSNFNISGSGAAGGTLTANVVNAATQYNIGGNRVLSTAGTNNVFAGLGAGAANTTGLDNSFFGYLAGFSNTTGVANSFFGFEAGHQNTTASDNAFFGGNAGAANTEGARNSFFGRLAGFVNTLGSDNAFLGSGAGFNNISG